MGLVRPHLTEVKGRTDDWLDVSAWMKEAEREIDDVETLGTNDPGHEFRPVPQCATHRP